MKVINQDAVKYFLGFVASSPTGIVQDVSSHGVWLPANGSVIIDDRYRSHPSLEQMISEGKVTVSGLSVSDEDDGEIVSAGEFNSHLKGIYRIGDDWEFSSSLGDDPTAGKLASSLDGPFNVSTYNILKVKFDGLDSQVVTVNLGDGYISKADLVAKLDADANFAKYGDAAVEGGGGWSISSKALGVNSSVEVIEVQGHAHEILGLVGATATATPGAEAVATVTINTYNASGEDLKGVSHAIKLYTTDIGGGSTVDTNHTIQRITKGTLVSGLHSAEAVIISGEDGQIIFEVAQDGNGNAEPFVGVAIPAAHFLADHPAARLELAP